MDNDRFSTVDSFPACAKRRRILMYYTVRSRRITVVTFGSRYLLLYSNKKKIKTFVLPESITCATIISTPRSTVADSDGKVLVCGTCCGSIFVVTLPSTREQVKRTAIEGTPSGKGFRLVYKYEGLDILCIACIEGRLFLVGKDDAGERQMILFEACVMEDALMQLRGDSGGTANHGNFEAMPLMPPSILTATAHADLELVVLRSEQTRGSPYRNSLDCIQYLEDNLFRSLFRFATCDTLAPVACFFFPGGEVWYRTLQGGAARREDLEHLCSLTETCSLVTVAEVSGKFLQRHGCESVVNDAAETTPFLLLFGENDNVCFVNASREEPQYRYAPEVSFVAYPVDVKALSSDWNSLVSRPTMYLRYLREKENGVTSSSVVTNFTGEQRIGLEASSELWTFRDEGTRSSLIAAQISNFYDHEYSAGASCQVQDLLNNLGHLNLQHQALQEKSSKLNHALEAVKKLSMVLNEPVCQGVVKDVMKLTVKYETVQYPDGERVNVIIKVPCHSKSVLSNFVCELHVTWRCRGAPEGRTNIFSMNDDNSDTNLCISIDRGEFLVSDKGLKLTVFLNLLGFKNVTGLTSDLGDVLNAGFPVLIAIHSSVLNLAV